MSSKSIAREDGRQWKEGKKVNRGRRDKGRGKERGREIERERQNGKG